MTYKDVLDDIHVEVNQPAEMSKIPDEFLVAALHNRMQMVSERSVVEDRVYIALSPDVVEYNLSDRNPFEIRKVRYARLTKGDDLHDVDVIDIDQLLDIERRMVTWAGTTAPRQIALWREGSEEFLKIQPTAADGDEEQMLTLYVHALYLTYKLHSQYKDTDQEILFPARYLHTLKWGVKADLYGYLKQYELQQQALMMFETFLTSGNVNRGVHHRTKITFT